MFNDGHASRIHEGTIHVENDHHSFQGIRYPRSLRLNTFCIINVCLIPSGDSDSLWYSYSSAYTAFGYQNVITMITGAESLYRMNGFHALIIL